MDLTNIDIDFLRELAEIENESMGWVPLYEGTYLRIKFGEYSDNSVIEVAGLPKIEI